MERQEVIAMFVARGLEFNKKDSTATLTRKLSVILEKEKEEDLARERELQENTVCKGPKKIRGQLKVFLYNMVNAGCHTREDMISAALKSCEKATVEYVNILLSWAKNKKYRSLGRLAKRDENGIWSFVE